MVGPDEAPIGGRHPISPDGAWIALSTTTGIRLISTSGLTERTIGGPRRRDAPGVRERRQDAVHDADSGDGALDRTPRSRDRQAHGHTTVTTPPEARGYFTIRMSSDGATVAYSALANAWDMFVIELAR